MELTIDGEPMTFETLIVLLKKQRPDLAPLLLLASVELLRDEIQDLRAELVKQRSDASQPITRGRNIFINLCDGATASQEGPGDTIDP